MADPLWTEEAHALAVAIHDAACHDRTCPATVIAAVYGKAAIGALEHLGPRLLPPGGNTTIQERYRDVDGFTAIGPAADDPERWRLDATREVTRWPDDSWHFGPWQPSDTPGEPA